MPIPSHHGPARHVHSIVLVRHGRTSYNAAHRLQGQIDIPLDKVGEWQVRQTGDALADLFVRRCPDVPNQVVVASDLGLSGWTCIWSRGSGSAVSASGRASRLRNWNAGIRMIIVPGLTLKAAS